jgi:hypothetical protein
MNNTANHAPKKRKYESPQGTVTPGIINNMLNIKAEPGECTCSSLELQPLS